MGWLAIIALLCVAVLLVYLGWCWGVWAERREQASREEAIRLQAYKDGRKSIMDEIGSRSHWLNAAEWEALYRATWTTPQNDTKESS